MSNIVQFPGSARRSSTSEKAKRKRKTQAKSFCKKGFHKWRIDQKKQFDVKSGKLVTIRRCERCGTVKTTLD